MHRSRGREYWNASSHSLTSLFVCLSCMPHGGCQSNKTAEAFIEQCIQLINGKTTQNKSHLRVETAQWKHIELGVKEPRPAPLDKVL